MSEDLHLVWGVAIAALTEAIETTIKENQLDTQEALDYMDEVNKLSVRF